MNVIDALTGEHGVLRRQVEALVVAAPGVSDEILRALVQALVETLESHANLEDELLFDELAATGRMPSGPVEAMRQEHELIVSLLGQLLAGAEPGRPDPARTVSLLAETVRDHFDHEEHALFPLSHRVLDRARLEELGSRWGERRGVAVAFAPVS